MMKQLTNKTIKLVSGEQFLAIASRYRELHLDIGAGDGQFAYHLAKEHPEILVIALEPNIDRVKKLSVKLKRKPEKGGLDNLIIVKSLIESPPEELHGLMHHLYILYPWSGLLRALLKPELNILERIVHLGRPKAEVDILINAHPFNDPSYCCKNDLPPTDIERIETTLAEKWREAGLETLETHVLQDEEPPLKTTWGLRFVRGSDRTVWWIRMVVDR